MTATLRVVLDQLVAPTSPDLAEASAALARALIDTAPRGADVAGIVPRGADPGVAGLADLTRLPLPRRELAASWQLGVFAGVGAGMVHSPSLLAPFVRHDRVHDTHQIVATVWDLRAWERPETLRRTETAWQRAMMKRATRHADAIVVPARAMAARLEEIAPRLAGRIRVIAGAPAPGFRPPTDEAGRLRSMRVTRQFAVVAAGNADAVEFAAACAGLAPTGLDVVVLRDAGDPEEAAAADVAAAAGLRADRLHVRSGLEPLDRAALFSGAELVLAPSAGTDWPWRVVEALAVGAPIVAADSPVHREVLADAALLADAGGFAGAVAAAVGATSARLRVLSADRGPAFSWREAAERVWQLHADL